MAKPPRKVVEAQQARIEPEEIVYLVTEMAKRHDEGADWYTQIAILADRYPMPSERPFAISERMECLLKMLKDERMRGWSMEVPDNHGCILTNEAVFRAAALVPLHIVGERFKFDAEEFFSIVLGEADAEGNA